MPAVTPTLWRTFGLALASERVASYNVCVERIEWTSEAAEHIRSRSTRYAGAFDIEPEWTAEAVNDPDRLVDEPDPNSTYANSVRAVGYSHSARTVITVVALRGSDRVLHGASAWKTSGAALRQYKEAISDD